jgi:hypothetical protein
MDVAIYEIIGANQVAVGREVKPPVQVTIARVAAVIEDVPEGTLQDEIVQWLFSAGRALGPTALIAPETEWPQDVHRMISRETDPSIETFSWNESQ